MPRRIATGTKVEVVCLINYTYVYHLRSFGESEVHLVVIPLTASILNQKEDPSEFGNTYLLLLVPSVSSNRTRMNSLSLDAS